MAPAASSAEGARPTVVLLGAQRFDPTLNLAMDALQIAGPMAVITAGWQEREDEDEEISAHVGRPTINLRLHARGEEVFKEDPELRDAHRERQDALRHRQDFYRIRLEQAVQAALTIEKRPAPPDLAAEQRQTSLDILRELDARHLAVCARLHQEFEERWSLKKRPSIARHRKEIAKLLSGCTSIAIAGGHVATLINRLALFGIGKLARDRTVFAWSGGAMAISEQVVLFHDNPPQGPSACEVLDLGLGLVPGVVVLPQPEQRLQLERAERVRWMVQRFAPSRCLALPARSRLTWDARGFSFAEGIVELLPDGGHQAFLPALGDV